MSWAASVQAGDRELQVAKLHAVCPMPVHTCRNIRRMSLASHPASAQGLLLLPHTRQRTTSTSAGGRHAVLHPKGGLCHASGARRMALGPAGCWVLGLALLLRVVLSRCTCSFIMLSTLRVKQRVYKRNALVHSSLSPGAACAGIPGSAGQRALWQLALDLLNSYNSCSFRLCAYQLLARGTHIYTCTACSWPVTGRRCNVASALDFSLWMNGAPANAPNCSVLSTTRP